MSLIYAEKFEFENSAIMKDKQCKRTDNIQGYDPYQIKKEELSGDIRKFPSVK